MNQKVKSLKQENKKLKATQEENEELNKKIKRLKADNNRLKKRLKHKNERLNFWLAKIMWFQCLHNEEKEENEAYKKEIEILKKRKGA